MKNNFSKKEIEFFHRLRGTDSAVRIAVTVKTVSIVSLFTILVASVSGFYILRDPESLFWGVIGLVLLSVFYLIGKSIARQMQSNEDPPYPMYKRVFHFLMVLCMAGFILALEIFAFRHM